MTDPCFNGLDLFIILCGFATCATLAGLTTWIVNRAVAAKRRKTALYQAETSYAALADKDGDP